MSTIASTYTPVRWRESLVFRVIFLCAILLLLLLGMVYALSRYFLHEIRREMEGEVQHIADSVQLEITANPEADLADIERTVTQKFQSQGYEVNLRQSAETQEPRPVALEVAEGGHIRKVAQRILTIWDRPVLLTASVTISPRTEMVLAFRNKYLALLAIGFVVTLMLMTYYIVRILRPLGELSASCAEITAGHLRNVEIRKSSGEVQALERTFNTMVAALRDKEIVEANLRQAQRLTAIGTLAAGVAHDIRNPLNAIKLLSSHALDKLNALRDGGEAARHVQTIRNEVDRLEEIVSGFLSLAKERELRPEPSKIDVLLAECVRLMKPDAEAREVRLIAELRAGDLTLMLDPKQWTRAILNVLINAMEACPKGGRVRLFSRLTDTACEIEIRDDGHGLSKEAAECAFDPYFTTKATGTGLGLSITRGIIEEHGGAIQLSGTEDQGCQALIKLPMAQPARMPALPEHKRIV